MGTSKAWTKEEMDYLCDNWGMFSQKHIAEKLGRSVEAIRLKSVRLKLGSMINSGEYVTVNQLKQIISGTSFSGYNNISWVKNRGFPLKHKLINVKRIKVVYVEDFWKWAEKNRSIINFSVIEENILGFEPEWVKNQRKLDFKIKRIKKTPWTADEDSSLKSYLKLYRYNYDDISNLLGRTCGAIQRRILDLGIKERPLRMENHNPWKRKEVDDLLRMVENGYSYELMAEKIKRSSKAIRGKVYNMYGTESLDKVRRII